MCAVQPPTSRSGVDHILGMAGELLDLVDAMFETFDTDKDGVLSAEDLNTGLQFINTPETQSLLEYAGSSPPS